MKVVYMKFPPLPDAWHEAVWAAVGDGHEMVMFDPRGDIHVQLKGVDVIVDQGGLQATREMIEIARTEGLKLYQVQGTGLDHTDVEYISGQGIPIANTPGNLSAIGLAEHALMLMLALGKNLITNLKEVNSGQLSNSFNLELGGRTLGLVGFGASGKELAKRAWCLGMRIIAIDALDITDESMQGVELDFRGKPEDLDRLLRDSDYLSLHCPLTEQTRGLIDERALSLMKPEAILINVARADIVNEQALIEAIEENRIRGVGMDVAWEEPIDPGHPLLKFDNVIITPHTASSTIGIAERRAAAIAENIDRVARGEAILHRVELPASS